MKEIPTNLDWVSVRAKCEISHIFDSLKDEVQKDVTAQNSSTGNSKFSVQYAGDSFTVLCADGGGVRAIVFALSGKTIQIKNGDRVHLFSASLTLNDTGECKLKVDNQELESWQLRRRALEELFFGAE